MVLTDKIRRGALVVALGLATAMPAAPSFAQQLSESHLAAARDAVAAIDATEQFDVILLNAATQIKAELIVNNPHLQEKISTMVDEAALALAPRRADLENEAARVYAKIFTEQELREIAEFYASETGQKLIRQGPIATREVLAAADIWARGIIRDLRQNAYDGLREIAPGVTIAQDADAPVASNAVPNPAEAAPGVGGAGAVQAAPGVGGAGAVPSLDFGSVAPSQ